MRRAVLLLTVVGAVLFACAGVVLAQQITPDTSQPAEAFAAGDILVKFKDRTSEEKKQEVHEKRGGQVKESIRGIGVQVVSVPDGKEKSKAKEYKDDPNVEFAELNGVYKAVQTANEPNDPGAPGQWQYKNTQYTEPKKGDIDAYEAWNGGSSIAWDGGTIGSSSVAIAILDTGIKEDHEDLQGKVTSSINYTDSPTNDDIKGHGTHVAGSAAAITNNGAGLAGTCPGCTLYNVKVLGDTGNGYYSWIANGITWAADHDANVINLSLGGSSPTSTLQSAVDYAWDKGVVVVAAAGNSNTNALFYPAAYNNAIAVGATDNNDAKANFSNYGSSWVDVAAPGVGILSTMNKVDDPSTTTVDESYGTMNGTSMASPHVAGVAGLVWSKSGLCGTADNTCVRDQIESKADQIGGTGTYWAKGRINANGAVGGATIPPPASDTTPPETTIDSGPSGTVNSSSASFGFSSSEADSTFECRLDSGTWDPCTSPKEYASLADGSHTFEVKATDPAENADATPASRTWTVDATAPMVLDSSLQPANGATGVQRSTTVSAKFSEDMNSATLTTTSTVTLVKDGTTTPITATVSYDPTTTTVTLKPSARLEPNKKYWATVKGGTGGASDKAGNPLAANKVWSFTTGSK